MFVLVWAINCLSLYYMMKSFDSNKQKIICHWVLVCLLQLLLLIIIYFNQLPLLFLYLILYFIKFFVFKILSKNYRWRLMVTNISFISVISCHLIFIALTALYFHQDMSTIISASKFTICYYMLFLLFDIIVNVFISIKKNKINKLLSHVYHQQYLYFEYFLWFCCIFLLIQSVLSQQDHFPIYISIFLMCNDLLLLILIFCFIQNIYEINEQLYVEKEHELLEKESENRRKNMEDMRKYADFDILTNTHSRKYIMKYMQNLKQNKILFSIIFIDLDHLKSINDCYGHSAGDQYLRHFAETMQMFLREGDILARIGGDEFLIVMKATDKKHTQIRMDEINQKIQDNHLHERISFSYGIATFDIGMHDIDDLIKEADAAMYAHKFQKRKEEKKC